MKNKVNSDSGGSRYIKEFYGIYIRQIDEYELYKKLDENDIPAMNTLLENERKQLAIDICNELGVSYFNQTNINIQTLSEK